MATESQIKDWSAVAENDLSAKQYYALELNSTAGQVDVPDGATDLVVGVLQNAPEAGEIAQVRSIGFSKLVASAAISIGAKVGTTNAGKGVAKSADADNWFGIAHTAAAADGDIITVQLCIGAQRAN